MRLGRNLALELLYIFSLPVFILLIHIPLEIYDVYHKIPWIDIPMHFLGGLVLGRSIFMLIKLLQREGHIGNIHGLAYFTFVVSIVALAAVAWESQEFLLDLTDNAMRQPSLANTMQDLILGVLGGAIGCLMQFYFEHRNK